MNTQLLSFLRTFVSVLFGWLSDPQHVRLVLTVVAVCLMLAALLIPVMTATANPIPGGGGTNH